MNSHCELPRLVSFNRQHPSGTEPEWWVHLWPSAGTAADRGSVACHVDDICQPQNHKRLLAFEGSLLLREGDAGVLVTGPAWSAQAAHAGRPAGLTMLGMIDRPAPLRESDIR